jgi:GT2 family glycosyltransferase/glycosyltransferase involved in cell wall biosynthesis
MGAALPEHLMVPDPACNERGFWEPIEIVRLHDELMATAGTSWDDLGEFPAAWYESPAADSFVGRMADLVGANYGDAPLFVLKDPRLCRLVPFWQRVLERLEIRPGYVMPVRNPLEVAASLRKRNGFSASRSHLLWLRHVLDAERGTRGTSRSLVTYEALLADHQGTLGKIAGDLGISWPRDSHRAWAEVGEFLTDSLRHNRSSREDLARDERTTRWVGRTYDALQKGVHGDHWGMAAELDAVGEEFRAAGLAFGPLLAETSLSAERAREWATHAATELAGRDAAIAGLEAARAGEAARADGLATELGAKATTIAALEAELAGHGATIAGLQSSLAEAGTKADRLAAELDEAESRAESLEEALSAEAGKAEELAAELAGRDAAIARLEASLGEWEASVGRLEAELADRETSIARLETTAAAAGLRAGGLEAALSEAVARADRLELYRRELEAVGSSRAWAMAQAVSRAKHRLAPPFSRRHRAILLGAQASRVLKSEGPASAARKAVRRLRGLRPAVRTYEPAKAGPIPIGARAEGDYAAWIARNEPDAAGLAEQMKAAEKLGHRPLISLLTPVLDTPAPILDATIWSIANQTYDHWELCLVDGGSTDPGTRQSLESWAARDPRVRVAYLDSNRGIAGNTNVALGMARGEFIALLDHDDMLPAYALYEVAKRIDEEPEVDFLYSDKDLINGDGTERFWPLFKPSWSPEVMLNANYLTHLTTMRTSLVREIGGWRPETDGAQDWDVFLRVLEKTDRVAHIPKVLYHWRLWGRSVASGLAAKPYVVQAQDLTLNEHLKRVGHDGALMPDPSILKLDPNNHTYRFRPECGGRDPVSIVVPTQVGSSRLPALLDEIFGRETDYENVEVVVVHCGPRTPQLRDYYTDLGAGRPIRVVETDAEPGSTAAYAAGARAATGRFLLFLSEGLRPYASDWLAELVQASRLPGVGVVGAKLITADDRIEHAGLVIGLDGLVGPIYGGQYMYHGDISGSIDWYRNYSAVSGQCLMIGRELYEQLGGFDESYKKYGADVALCLAAGEAGHRVVFTPYAKLRRVGEPPSLAGVPRSDLLRLYDRCLPVLAAGDRYYNPNLLTGSAAPRLRVEEAPETAHQKLTRALAHWEKAQAADLGPQCQPDAGFHEGRKLATTYNFTPAHLEASRALQATHSGPLEIRSINWFIPPFQNAYYGGIYTILRFASYLKRHKGVQSRFYLIVGGDPQKVHDAIAGAFPNLHGSLVQVVADDSHEQLGTVAYADACVSTLWSTAYYVLKFNRTRRKFYFVQDAEPLFYPAGSTSALTEVTYRFGFHGIANTGSLRDIYEKEHGGSAIAFTPCVDTELFRPAEGPVGPKRVQRVFYYGRPNNPRNGFELGCAALQRLKDRLGDRVEILAAGDRWNPEDYGLGGVVKNLGLMRFDQTSDLYRTCDAGLVMMFTRHPSYLPFEFMASGCLVVTNRNAATTWLLRDGENCLLTEPSADCIAETLEKGLADDRLRRRLTSNALDLIRREHSDWNGQIERVYDYMVDPALNREERTVQIRAAG